MIALAETPMKICLGKVLGISGRNHQFEPPIHPLVWLIPATPPVWRWLAAQQQIWP